MTKIHKKRRQGRPILENPATFIAVKLGCFITHVKDFDLDERVVLDLVEVHQGKEKLLPVLLGIDALAQDHPDSNVALENGCGTETQLEVRRVRHT